LRSERQHASDFLIVGFGIEKEEFYTQGISAPFFCRSRRKEGSPLHTSPLQEKLLSEKKEY